MEKEQKIKQLLIELKSSTNSITKLEEYNIGDIIEVALKNGLFESLLVLFKPISINNEMKIIFDPFSTNILDLIKYTCDSQEQAIQEAKKEYEEIQKRNSELSEEDKEWYYDSRSYEEILRSKIVFPSEIKKNFIKQLFTIDFDKINRIKIKNSHARQISGWGHPVNTIDDVIFYAEPACLQVCIDLFNKNIRTTMNDTDGVLEDGTITSGTCSVWIDYRTLSDNNREIIEELINLGVAERFMDGDTDTISIFVPCDGEQTVGEISQKLHEIVSRIKEQDVIYGRGTPEEVYQSYIPIITRYPFYAEGCFDNGITVEGIIKLGQSLGSNLIYDSEEGLIWNSPELYAKHKKYIASHPKEKVSPKK